MNGLLLVDKPSGWTSFDVVNYVRKIVAQFEGKKPKQVKVGHCGTLDPLATGLLILLIGNYTKRATELTKLDKTYEVTMKVGETSTTGDDEGEKSKVSDKKPTQQEVEKALQKFTGEIMQTPPAFSAMKINGQRAYKLARAGQEVKLEPRLVKIYKTKLTTYTYPFVAFTSDVSSGTYVRSLVEDLGKQLGTGAYMCNLHRSKIADFDVKDAQLVKDLNIETIQKSLQTP